MKTDALARRWGLAIILGMGLAGKTWASQTQVVAMAGSVFNPVAVTVSTGQVVQWTNDDGVAHTATSDPGNPVSGGPDSGSLSSGGTYSWSVPTNAVSGTRWFYHCNFHGSAGDGSNIGAGMAGVITVSGSGGISLETHALAFSATYQGANPTAQMIGLTNVGGAAFTYTNVITYGAGASGWLTVLPATGTVAASNATTLTNQVNITGINAGTYYATNQVTADATNSPQIVTVTLTVVGPGSLQFSSATYSANESNSSVTLTVTRINGSSGAASVQYAAAAGTASAGSDYTPQSGTLSWSDGDSASRTISVAIVNDSDSEGDETFTVSLSAAVGASLGSPSTATVTIEDDEPSAPAGVAASDGTYTNKVLVTWNSVANATSYEVWRSSGNNSNSAAKLGDSATTNYDDTSAASLPGQTLYYWVKAKNAQTTSAFSASDSGFLGVVGPLITANGLVGDVDLDSGDLVTIAVQMMNIEPYLGAEVDWWVVAFANSGAWYYLDSSPQWQEALFSGDYTVFHPVYQGPLANVSSTPVLSGFPLPSGTYDFWFAVDYPMDGILNLNGPILSDNVTVFVQ